MEGNSWGGSEELWYNVALESVNRNHRIQICINPIASNSSKIIKLKEKGAYIIARKKAALFANLISRISFGKLNISISYINQIEKFQPDVILISQGGTYDYFYRVELVGFIAKHRKPYFIISQFNAENGWIQSEYVKSLINAPSFIWGKFYFVSLRNLKSAERQIAYQIPNSAVVSNPVNLSNISIAPWPKEKFLKLACVARFECSFKGQDILLETLAEPEFEKTNYKLSFFGKGPDEIHLTSLINYYQLSEKVTIEKFTNDIDNIWNHHHVLILPSLGEGTPLSLQEAMLKGRPALTTDVGGSSTLVIDKETGFLAHTASVRCLKEKLLELFATSNENLKVMGENAFSMASSKINLNSSSEILIDLERSTYQKNN